MKRMMGMLLLGAAAAASFVQLVACEDDTTLNPSPHDAGPDAEAGEGGEAGKTEAGSDGGMDAAGMDAADAADANDAADGD
jgi:hypothetical protein